MTDQVLIKSQYAASKPTDITNVIDNVGMRVYRDSPYSINVQIRSKTGKKGRISSLCVNQAQAREIAAYLIRAADELRVYEPSKAAA